jgi:hypothetical protein
LILQHERLAVHRSCQERLKALYAEHAAKGCLQSGATAKAGMRIIEETGEAFVKTSVDQVAAVAMDIDAFALIVEETESLLSVLEGELGSLTFMASGSRDKNGVRSIVDAVEKLFRDANQRIMRQLEIHRFSFTKPTKGGLLNSERRSPGPNPGGTKPGPARAGRLPADWWDDLWIEIFRQVYLGDLKPKSQADIVKAMQQWLSDRDIEAADSTLKPRARKLLQMLQEAEG